VGVTKKESTKFLVVKAKRLRFIVFFLCLLATKNTFAQQDPSKVLAQSIEKSALKEHVKILSSNEMEGRENGKKGQKKAAAYIMQQFSKAGIAPIMGSYFQDVPFVEVVPEKVKISIGGKDIVFIKDFEHYKDFDNAIIEQASCVFVSHGSKKEMSNADKKFNIKDKVVFMVGGSQVEGLPSIAKRTKYAHKFGAKALIVVNDPGEYYSDPEYLLEREQNLVGTFTNPIPLFFIAHDFADSLFKKHDFKLKKWLKKKNKNKKSQALNFKIDIKVNMIDASQKGENVMAFIPGNEKKSEIVILLAHYDHLGTQNNVVFNGADDNATGTAALIEIAKTLQLAKSKGSGFKRSVLIILTTGEEKGLLGSKYYVNNPLFSIKQTFAVLNVDMIGRSDKKHKNNPNYVYLIGSNFISPVLQEICEAQNNKHTKLTLDYTYNSKNHPTRFYYRSDHYPFAKRGVPSVFYFSGIHKDYHEGTDTFEKINFSKVHLITQFVFLTAWDLLNTERLLTPKKL
jgi:hypothetical protein